MRTRITVEKDRCISFIGMPGSGKTTISRLLSKHIGWPWLDTDHLMESWFGMYLEDIKKTLGNKMFLKAEEQIVLMLDVKRFIIATGGSVIYSCYAMKKLKEMGKVIYLKAEIETIKKRIKNNPNRGLIIPPGQSLKELYSQRDPLYNKYADLKISTDDLSPDRCVKEIMKLLTFEN